MTSIAIIGAGALGGALAHRLAARNRVDEVRLIDPHGSVAAGKALDILESSPIDGFATRVVSAVSLAAAAGSAAIVLADLLDGGEIAGEPGLHIIDQLTRLESASPLLFAGANQIDLMAHAVGELRVSPRRVVGSAPIALEGAVRALAALALDASAVDVRIGVFGVPPRSGVVAWQSATLAGQPISARMPPHVMAAISSKLPHLWPPGPYALASAASRVAEALAHGTRAELTCFAALERSDEGRNRIAAVPVRIVRGGVDLVREPVLSRQERTAFDNGLL